MRDLGLIPGLGRSPGEGKGYCLQYSGLKNSMGSQRVGHDWTTFTHSLWSYFVDNLCVGCILSLFLSSFHTFIPPTILSFFFFFSFLNASIYRKLSIFVSMLQPQYPMANLTDTILEDRFHSHQWGNVAILFINLFTDNIILFKLISTFKNSSQL